MFITASEGTQGFIQKYVGEYGHITTSHSLGEFNIVSISYCADKCRLNQDCCVFEYSDFREQCTLRKECKPNAFPVSDYVLYQKSKKKHITKVLKLGK